MCRRTTRAGTSKTEGPNPKQIVKTKAPKFAHLVMGASCLFGIWCLGFGASRALAQSSGGAAGGGGAAAGVAGTAGAATGAGTVGGTVGAGTATGARPAGGTLGPVPAGTALP